MYNSWDWIDNLTNSVEALADTIITEINWTRNLDERWGRLLYGEISLSSDFIAQQHFI